MNERKKSNSVLSVRNSTELSHKDVAVSTESGPRLNDGQPSTRSTVSVNRANELTHTNPSKSSDKSNLNMDNEELNQAVEYLQSENELLEAAELGDDERLEKLLNLRETNINQMDHLGRTALHLAVCYGNVRSIQLLLDAGIHPNIKDNIGMTPLSLCLMRNPSPTIANLLFDHGAVILPRADPMDTGLFLQFVAMCRPTLKDEQLLELLVRKGALVNDPRAPGGRQALHIAAMGNNCRLIAKLIELGAKTYIKNARGETPKDFAQLFNCKEAFEFLSRFDEEPSGLYAFSSVDEVRESSRAREQSVEQYRPRKL